MDNKEDQSFVKFPQDIYDAILSQRLTITQERALLYIVRKTAGFHKEEDRISISRMATETGFCRRAMINAVHDLQKMGILQCGTITNGQPTFMRVLPPSFWDTNL